MKKFILTIFCLLLVFSSNSQKLTDLYKKGTIRLVPDTEYAKGNDWSKVFRSYQNPLKSNKTDDWKSLVIMADGSVIVNHTYTNYYTMFSPQGKFVKEFGIRNTKGLLLKKIMPIEGIINNNTFYTKLDNPGNMYFLDFYGKRIKTLKLNYSTNQMIALSNGNMAVVGKTTSNDKKRVFVALIDLATNKEKVIWEHNIDISIGFTHNKPFSYRYGFKSGAQIVYINSLTDQNDPPILAYIENNLIVSVPATGEILIFDVEGNLVSKEKVSWPTNYISVEEQKTIQLETIENVKTTPFFTKSLESEDAEEIKLAKQTIIGQMESDLDQIKGPKPIPAFITIIKDSDGNLLFFEYPDKEKDNKFNVWVYEKGGNFVCQSRFVCDDYDLKINPSRMAFRNGYMYSLQNNKNASGIPLRLVRFRMTAN